MTSIFGERWKNYIELAVMPVYFRDHNSFKMFLCTHLLFELVK